MFLQLLPDSPSSAQLVILKLIFGTLFQTILKLIFISGDKIFIISSKLYRKSEFDFHFPNFKKNTDSGLAGHVRRRRAGPEKSAVGEFVVNNFSGEVGQIVGFDKDRRQGSFGGIGRST